MSAQRRWRPAGRRGWAPLLAAACLAPGACKDRSALGPADAYVLLAPVQPPARSKGGLPVVEKLDLDRGTAVTVARLLGDGFAVEMVRTVHLAKQLARGPGVAGRRYPEALVRSASEPLALVVGLDSAFPHSKGLALKGMIAGTEEKPDLPWIGLPATLEDDRALVQTLSGRLAAHAASWAADIDADPASTPGPERPLLVEAYRMAMEVISREWRVGKGPAGALPSTAGSVAQRHLFADIRENRTPFTEGGSGRELRPAEELLRDPRVAATVLYRLAQTRTVANAVGPADIYAPFVQGPLPEGVSGAQLLGAVRNFNAKLFTAWARAALGGHPPDDIVDLVEAYGELFPQERREVLRIFLVTTFAGTVKRGGISRKPEEATAAIAEIGAIIEDLLAVKRSLRDGL
jgi:hypothetical protein